MMRKNIVVFVILGVLGMVFSQEKFKVKVNQVGLSVSVFKKDEPLILAKRNFRVFEKTKKGVLEQEIISFSSYNDQPVALIVAVDSSESMGFSAQKIRGSLVKTGHNKLVRAKSSALSLICGECDGVRLEMEMKIKKEMMRKMIMEGIPSDENGEKENFNKGIFRDGIDKGLLSEIYLGTKNITNPDGRTSFGYKFFHVNTGGWTEELNKMVEAVVGIKKPGGATPLVPALFYLSNYFLDEEVAGLLRVLVVISDGKNTPSIEKISAVKELDSIEKLQNNQVLVYSVGLYEKPVKPFLGFEILRNNSTDFIESIAETTGGQAYFAPDLTKLPEIFENIDKIIRNINFLSYISKSEDPGYREIIVEVGEWDDNGKWKKKDYKLFHRKGYNFTI